jgi:pimeloyl-ACP methyl ester carboxylesterase
VLTNLRTVLRAFDNGRLFGDVYGDSAPRVLFLHGWGRQGSDFRVAAESLAHEGIASVTLDLPGFGSSPEPSIAGGADLYADLVDHAWKDLTDGPLIVVGHSFGGRVAVSLAARHPARVAGLVLTGVPLLRSTTASSSPWPYRSLRRLRGWRLIPESVLERARQRYGSRDYLAAHGRMREVLVLSVNESYEDLLVRVHVPTTLLWGATDAAVPVEIAERAGALLTKSSLVVLEGVGHLLPTEAPAALAAAVRSMVNPR